MKQKLIKTSGAVNHPFEDAEACLSGTISQNRRIHSTVPALGLVPESVAREHSVVPMSVVDETLTLAASSRPSIAVTDQLRFLSAKNVKFEIFSQREIDAALNREYGPPAEESDTMIDAFCLSASSEDDLAMDCLAQPKNPDSEIEDIVECVDRRARRARPVRQPDMRRAGFAADSSTEDQGMFHYTVEDQQRVLVTEANGQTNVVVGPARLWKGRRRFERMTSHAAHPGEYLVIRFRDGRQQHLPGPVEEHFDRRVHESIEIQESLQIDANEAIVVYTRTDEQEEASRRIERGPQLFVPAPFEWLHTFKWHSSRGGSQGAPKLAKNLVFQKLWLMPDQMYHDVPDVRTADDAVLTIRLMIFFEMTDLEKMLDATHDPIGDFVNAATADVVEFTGQYEFEEFKQQTHRLNDLETYQHLLHRATQVGYQIKNVVYRGYGAPDSLQQMHDQAIEARTRLQLERATEEQAQQLEDFQLDSQLNRASRRRSEQSEEVKHDLQITEQRQEAEMQQQEAQAEVKRRLTELQAIADAEAQERLNKIHVQHMTELQSLGVDLTSYLVHTKPDKVVEVRGESAPHVHID